MKRKSRYKKQKGRQNLPVGRVVYRSNNNANANGGVAYANANNDPSNTNTNVGSRLDRQRKTEYRCTSKRDVSRTEVPRERSHASSSLQAGKAKNQGTGQGLVGENPKRLGPKVGRPKMKREGNIMAEVTDYSNLYAAIDEVLRGTARKECETGREILENREEVIARLTAELSDGSFEIGPYRQREIKEGGKLRRIQVLPIEKRIAINAVMRVVDEHLRRRFIRTTAASIKGRGMHDMVAYMCDNMRSDPGGTLYCYKFDITKFYESIDQGEVKKCVRRVFKDEVLLKLLDKFIEMMPHGLSMGLRSSQGLANLLLSMALDHYLKDEMGVRYYYRYCDDGVVLSGDKRELWMIRDIVHERLEDVGLKVKANERVFPVEEGIDFLGYVIYGADHVELRKRNKQNFARKMAKVKSRKRREVLTASFYGMAKHANCNNLYNVLTGKNMRSFKDLNVSYQPEDGKKRFAGATISIRELVNLPIVVKDFETGIKTDQGDDRTLVAIEYNGEPRKFFTSSLEMRNILEQIRELPDGFPFETTIKAEAFGKGRTKYIFT